MSVDDPSDREVVRLGCAARENDLWRVSPNERGDLAACTVDRVTRGPPERVMSAFGVAEVLAEDRRHLLHDARVAGVVA